jgi:hypothetical protein
MRGDGFPSNRSAAFIALILRTELMVNLLCILVILLQVMVHGSVDTFVPSTLTRLRAQESTGNASDSTWYKRKMQCKTMKNKFNVRPGTSWGSMTASQQEYWMKIRCDVFFCKADKKQGRGSYNCISLPDST